MSPLFACLWAFYIKMLLIMSFPPSIVQIDPSEKLDPEVEDILVDIAEDFVESVS